MKKYLLPILLIAFWSCEEEVVEDTTPPTVTITSPQDGYIINLIHEIITITCMSSDNEGVQKVELWVNGVSTGIIDDIEPYSFDWNTATLGDGNYTIIIRAYDTNDNITDSEPIILTIHKTKLNLWGETYLIEETDSLWLDENGLTGSIPPEIGNLTNLKYLSLSNNQLTGEIPPEIGNLTNLTGLRLYGNQLTGEIPSEICNLTNLEHLVLGYNELTGSIPSEIANLTNLESLYFNNNQLTGSIPSEIGNLTNLVWLSLDHNQLTGSIPVEIGYLSNVYKAYLNDNQLTGLIPDIICGLDMNPFHFYIYNNQLCPPYPSCIEEYVGEQDTTNCD